MKKIVAGSTAVLLMLTASGALIGCKSTPDESTSSSDSSLESTSSVDSAGADAGFDIDGEERESDSSGEGDDAEAPDGDAAAEGSGETAREGAQSWITSDGTASSNREDEKKEGGFGNSYGLASGEGVNGDGVAVMKGGEAGEVDTSASGSAPNDEENFPSTMERLKNAGKGSASSDGTKADGDGADASAGAGTETASAESGGSRQSAVAPNANDSSTAGLGDRSKNNSGSGSGTGSGAGTGTGGKAANGSASGSGANGTSGGSAKNGNTKNNGSGISGTSSIDGSRNANPTAAKPQAESRTGNKNDKSSSANGSGTGSAAQNGTNKNGTGSVSGSGVQNGNKNGMGAGTGSGTGKNGTGTASANSGSNKNASGNGGNGTSTNASGTNANGNGRNAGAGTNATAGASGNGAGNASGKDASASSASKGTNTGKEIAKADGTSGGTGLSTNGSGNAGNGAGGTAAKDRQGMTGDDTTDYVEKFSKWFHPALADVQRCGYFYTTPEICQFDMIQGDFRKVSGYKKAAYGFVFGYSQPDPRGYLSDYIRFEINVDGEYALYTWDGQNYVDLVEPNDRGTAYFYEHPAIYKGYNTLNQIKIEDTGSSYNVYVNGTLIQGNIPYLTGRATRGVMAFFSVAKEHQEDLPRTPVNVGMRITDVKRH